MSKNKRYTRHLNHFVKCWLQNFINLSKLPMYSVWEQSACSFNVRYLEEVSFRTLKINVFQKPELIMYLTIYIGTGYYKQLVW